MDLKTTDGTVTPHASISSQRFQVGRQLASQSHHSHIGVTVTQCDHIPSQWPDRRGDGPAGYPLPLSSVADRESADRVCARR